MTESSLPTEPRLVHLGTMTATLGEQFFVKNGPVGSRVIAEVDSVELVSDRVTASMVGKSAADWLTLGPDGSYGTLDVRFTLKSDDDEIIYVEYSGRINLTSGQVTAAPLFQTGSDKYDWLNRLQVIGLGQTNPGGLVYELYEVTP